MKILAIDDMPDNLLSLRAVLLAALAVMLPVFFQTGYLFLLDMVWGPGLQPGDFADQMPAHYPLILLFDVLVRFLPAEFLQKLLLSTLLYLCAASMFNLARLYIPHAWAVLSALAFMLNPYVFERLAAGQWLVLAGYAFFPLIIFLFLHFLKSAHSADRWLLALALAVYPILSPHWAYMAGFFLLLLGLIDAFKTLRRRRAEKTLPGKTAEEWLSLSAASALFFLLASHSALESWPGSYGAYADPGGFEAFRTVADSSFGIYFNVLALYGFWQNAFLLPKDVFAYWWLTALSTVLFSLLGLIHLSRQRSSLARAASLAFVPALLIAVGFGDATTRPLSAFLAAHLPGFYLLRETEKAAGVLAFSYALFFPSGARLSALRLRQSAAPRARRLIPPLLWSFSLLLVLLSVSNMFRGLGGQLRAYAYPASWSEADALVGGGGRQALFLPWHGYMPLDFAGSANVANPARAFFRSAIVSGRNLDNAALRDPAQGEWNRRIAELLDGRATLEESLPYLHQQDIGYVILAKTFDFDRYVFLDQTPALRKLYDAPEIAVYEVRY